MRVNFDLSSLSEGILAEHMQAMVAMQGSIPIFAGKIQEWIGAEQKRRREKTARRQASETVEMVLPLLCKKELEYSLAAMHEFTWKLEVLVLEIAFEDKDLSLAREYKLAAAFSCAVFMALAAQLQDLRAAAERPVN